MKKDQIIDKNRLQTLTKYIHQQTHCRDFRIRTLNIVNEVFQFEATRRFEDTGCFYLHLTTSTTYTFLA
jgi:hypothetical protein